MFFDKDLTTKLAFAAVGKFILIFVGSAFIGVLVGAICSFVSILICFFVLRQGINLFMIYVDNEED